MYADVSVEVYIMSARDTPPVFERNDDKFFLTEDAPIGKNKNFAHFSVTFRIWIDL